MKALPTAPALPPGAGYALDFTALLAATAQVETEIAPDNAVALSLGRAEVSMTEAEVVPADDLTIAENSNGLFQIWRIRSEGPQDWSSDAPERAPERSTALIDYGEGAALALLPLPWRSAFGQPMDVEILYDAGVKQACPVRVSVRDPEMSVLISYLGAGRMAEAAAAAGASDLSEVITRLVQSKFRNPLAAAAGAYVGFATSRAGQDRTIWAPWLKTLMNSFPGLPDGAILYGRDRLECATCRADLLDALSAFKLAYSRGAPYFAAGVQHLLNGLLIFAQEDEKESKDSLYDPQAKAMHAAVAALALRVDPHQAFTVIILPENSTPHV